MAQKKIAFATNSHTFPSTPDDRRVIELALSEGYMIESVIWDQDKIKKLKEFDLIILRSIWDYHKKFEQFQSWLDEIQTHQIPLLNSIPVIRWNSSKAYLFKLEKERVPIIPTWLVREEDLDQVLFDTKNGFGDKIILKPIISASSDLTFLISRENRDEIREKLRVIQERCPALLQPFCESIQMIGEFSLIFFKSGETIEFSHAVLKKPSHSEFRVQTEYGGSTEPISPSIEMKEIGRKALEQVKHPWLYARVDFVLMGNQPCVGELEMIEPLLYFQYDSDAPMRFLKHLKNHL
jgi:glutathione synthase/RimK-type ligase-like ATP-grasp enzyme